MALHLGDAYLRILVNTKDLISGMGQAKQITEQATTEIERQWEHFFGTLESGQREAADVVAQSTQEIQTNWLAVGAAYGAVAAAGTMLMKQAIGTAMRTQELGIVLENVGKNAGYTQEALDPMVESMKKMGMSSQAAMTVITQMIQSEIDLAGATKLARAAQDMAVISMEDSSTAAMGLIRAITTMNPMLLRRYGIMTGLEEVDRKAGLALGILTYKMEASGKQVAQWSRELTTAERKQSVFNTIIQEGSKFAGVYTSAMEAPGKALRSFSRYIMEAQEAIAKYWLPALNMAVGVATKFIKAFISAPEIVHQLAGALLVGVTAVTAMTAAIILKTSAMGALVISTLSAQVAIGAFTVSLAVATLGLSLIIAAIVMLAIKLREHSQRMEEARQTAFEMQDTYQGYAMAMDKAGASAFTLSREVWELAKAERDATEAQRILIESADYDDYKDEMEAAGLSVKTLAEELWEAERAQVTLTGTTVKSIIEIEKEAQVRDKVLDALRQSKGGYDELAAASAILEGKTVDLSDAHRKEVEQLALNDAATRELAVAEGLLSQEAVDLVESIEASDRAMLSWTQSTQELRIETGFYAEALEGASGVVKEHAETTSESMASIRKAFGVTYDEWFGYLDDLSIRHLKSGEVIKSQADNTSDAMATLRASFGVTYDDWFAYLDELSVRHLKSIKIIDETMRQAVEINREALDQISGIVDKYTGQVEATWDDFYNRVESNALSHQMSMREAEINYQVKRADLVARASAEINALEAAGLTEKAATRRAKFDEELTMLEYNYETQKAWAAWNWEIQQLMQEQAHYLRLAETAEFASKEAQIVVEQAQAKLAVLMGELTETAVWAKSKLELFAAVAAGSADSARDEILSLQAVIEARKAAVANWEADMTGHLARVDAISADIQALITAGPQLPEMPDFSQWVGDFSTGMAKSGSGMQKSAKKTAVSVTKTLKDAIIDIADGFSAAMEIFAEVAKYKTPTGLAVGMKMLREDIEEAVRQMYIAYREIGEDGVKGAKLIAEAAETVIKTLGIAVEVFTEGIADYKGILPSAIDILIGDIEYVLVQVSTRLMSLWGWAGPRGDTVWGHMESWAEAVGAVVNLIGQAVITFTLLKDYTGIMPGIINLLADDIKLVLEVMDDVFDDFADEAPDQAKTAWLEYSAKLLELVAGMIDDLKKLSTFRGDIDLSSLLELTTLLEKASRIILVNLQDAVPNISKGTLNDLKLQWLNFTVTVIGIVAGAIDNLNTIGDFQGNIDLSNIRNLAILMEKAAVQILAALQETVPDISEGSLNDIKRKWLEFTAGTISIVVGIIDNLKILAAYQGDLHVSQNALQQLISTLAVTVINISYVVNFIDEFNKEWGGPGLIMDEFAQNWLNYATGLIGILAQVISDMKILASFKGGLQVSQKAIKQLIITLAVTTKNISAVISYIDKTNKEWGGTGLIIDEFAQNWLEFATGIISMVTGAIEDLEKVADFGGGLEVTRDKVRNLIDALTATAKFILGAIGDLTAWFDAEGNIIPLNQLKQKWLEFAAGLISLLAGTIADIEAISAFEGDLIASRANVTNLVDALFATTKFILSAIGDLSAWFDAEGNIDATKQLERDWLEFATSVVGIVAAVIEDIEKITAFEGDLEASRPNIRNLIDALVATTKFIIGSLGDLSAWFEDGTLKVEYQLKVAWVEFSTSLVSAIAGIIEDIKAIAAFEGVDEITFNISLTNLFDALYWFLDEFNRRANTFAGVVSEESAVIAELMGQTVSALGSAVQPILDVVAFAVNPSEAAVAIGKFFDALSIFLDILEEQTDDFADEADQDTADLATIIGEIVSGIGAAVDPLIKIMEYNPEVTNIAAAFNRFFGHLDAVLIRIEQEKNDWEVSDAAIALSAAIQEVTGSLKSAVDFLTGLAEYATGEGSPLTGFYAFWVDLRAIFKIISDAEFITEAAVTDASDFLVNVNKAVSDINTAIGQLNSLSSLPTENVNLVQAGKNLIKSLVDGFVAASNSEWGRVLSTIGGLINNILTRLYNSRGQLREAGWQLGSHMISGWIDGLNDRAGELYDTIRRIVNEAIAAANDAAGIASRSQVMFDFGNQMTQGLIEGLQAQQTDVIGALTGMLGMPNIILAPQSAGREQQSAGLSSGPINVSVTTLEPAPIAREVAFALNRQRLQAELNASRG